MEVNTRQLDRIRGFRGSAVLTYCLGAAVTHAAVFFRKLVRKIGDIYGSTKDPVNKDLRQGVIYSIPYHDYHQRYIG